MTDAMEAPSVRSWQDPAVPVATRVSDLMSQMTLVEKVAQLSGLWGVDPAVGKGLGSDVEQPIAVAAGVRPLCPRHHRKLSCRPPAKSPPENR